MSQLQNSGWMSGNPTLSPFSGWNEMHGGSMDRSSSSGMDQRGEAGRRSRVLQLAHMSIFLIGFITALLMPPSASAMGNFHAELLAIQRTWAEIKYQTPKNERQAAFESLLKKAEALQRMYPDSADAMLWSAVVLYHYAGEVRGIKALGMVKQSHHLLHRAEKKDPKVEDGLIHTALGQLYYKVPGWPIAFGDDHKAVTYLRQAIAFNPDGLDANYFMGDYLLRKKHYHQAAMHLRRAIQAPARLERPIADAGRKADARKLLKQAESQSMPTTHVNGL